MRCGPLAHKQMRMPRNGFIIHFIISLKADRPYKATVVRIHLYNLATVVYSDIPWQTVWYISYIPQLEALMSPTQSVTHIYDFLDLWEINVVEGTLVLNLMMINNWSLILFMQMRPMKL